MAETISIIIPTFQHAKTLPACLDSIFAQTRLPDEVIVVDDGSTDQTYEVLKPYLSKIVLIKQTNQGAPVARNNGFEQSCGSLVLFCDADIVMKPQMLQTLETTLRSHPEASYAYSGFMWGWKVCSSYPFDPVRLKKENFIHTSALIKRTAFPGFDPSLKRFQDWDLWLTMLKKGNTGQFVPNILYQVTKDASEKRISFWLPSPLIRFPWQVIRWKPRAIQKYDEAKQCIINKHHLYD